MYQHNRQLQLWVRCWLHRRRYHLHWLRRVWSRRGRLRCQRCFLCQYIRPWLKLTIDLLREEMSSFHFQIQMPMQWHITTSKYFVLLYITFDRIVESKHLIIMDKGSYKCKCKAGFKGDGKICIDVNECYNMQHECHSLATCTNYDGGYSCNCPGGESHRRYVKYIILPP